MNSIDSCGEAKNEPSPITKWLVETRNIPKILRSMLSLPHPFFGLQTDSNFSFDMPMTSRCQHCCQIFAEATLYFPLQTQGAAAISPVVSTYGGHRFWVPKYWLIQDVVRSTSTYIVSTNCVNARTQSGPNSSTKTRLVKFGKLIYSSPSL